MLCIDMRSLCAAVVLNTALCALVACGTREPDCGCTVQVGSERRTIGCGESACIASSLQYCQNAAEIVDRGACSVTSNGGQSNQAGTSSTAPPDMPEPHACDDLLTYCSTSCSSPPTASADCQATAGLGDDDACERWLLTNGILCHP